MLRSSLDGNSEVDKEFKMPEENAYHTRVREVYENYGM